MAVSVLLVPGAVLPSALSHATPETVHHEHQESILACLCCSQLPLTFIGFLPVSPLWFVSFVSCALAWNTDEEIFGLKPASQFWLINWNGDWQNPSPNFCR